MFSGQRRRQRERRAGRHTDGRARGLRHRSSRAKDSEIAAKDTLVAGLRAGLSEARMTVAATQIALEGAEAPPGRRRNGAPRDEDRGAGRASGRRGGGNDNTGFRVKGSLAY